MCICGFMDTLLSSPVYACIPIPCGFSRWSRMQYGDAKVPHKKEPGLHLQSLSHAHAVPGRAQTLLIILNLQLVNVLADDEDKDESDC